jgi:DNA helicase HerA-like ATPase
MQTAPAVHSTVRFAVPGAVDEAHRVSSYKAVKAMVSEQRSKGVAVILATQRPGQLPPEVETNAQTKAFLNLPGQDAKEAAKRLDPDDKDLPELIRNLNPGEAFVSIGGPPVLVKLRQYWRDDAASPPPNEP